MVNIYIGIKHGSYGISKVSWLEDHFFFSFFFSGRRPFFVTFCFDKDLQEFHINRIILDAIHARITLTQAIWVNSCNMIYVFYLTQV